MGARLVDDCRPLGLALHGGAHQLRRKFQGRGTRSATQTIPDDRAAAG
jgi:hypothetical protein